MFRTRNSSLGGGRREVGIDGAGVNIGGHLLEEVLADEVWEVRVTDVLPKVLKALGVFCG